METRIIKEKISAEVERMLGKKANHAAIVMALRRHGENLQAGEAMRIKLKPHTQLKLKTSLVYFSVKRSPDLFRKLGRMQALVDYAEGDTFNVIHGNNEASIITDEKHEKEVIAAIEGAQVTTRERGLVSITLGLDRNFPYTPGVIFSLTRKLYWDNINIFELVTTATELALIFQKKDAMRAYSSMQEMIDEQAKP